MENKKEEDDSPLPAFGGMIQSEPLTEETKQPEKEETHVNEVPNNEDEIDEQLEEEGYVINFIKRSGDDIRRKLLMTLT